MNKSVVLLSILANFFLLLALAVPAQTQGPATNPYALYGGCWKGVPYNGSSYRFKLDGVEETGFITKLANVGGIVVLDCHHWDGGGGFFVTECPAGSPYSFCVQNNNDGQGNHIYMGVLELNSTTDPNTQYGGCAPGSGFRKKADVLLEARPNIRNINSIVVTECHAADGAPGTVRVPCPKGSFYAACFKNSDDGVGNHVEFGVVNSFGSSDPVGQYGGYSPGHSIYRNKSALVTDVGKSLDKVVGITVVFGSDNFGGGTRIVPCGILSFTYCIESDGDPTGGGVFVGVTERP